MPIRPARTDDIPAIRQLGIETWHVAYRFAGEAYIADGLTRWWTEDALRLCLEQTRVLVAEHDGRVVAVGNLDTRDTTPIIRKLYVHPHAQGRRLGSTMLAALICDAPPTSTQVQLEYVTGNEPAAAFYAAKGFREVRREAGLHTGWPDTVWVALELPACVTSASTMSAQLETEAGRQVNPSDRAPKSHHDQVGRGHFAFSEQLVATDRRPT